MNYDKEIEFYRAENKKALAEAERYRSHALDCDKIVWALDKLKDKSQVAA
jgi:hypothetical protein